MPNPAFDPAPFEIRRVDGTGEIVAWARSAVGVRVGIRLTNSIGQTATVTQVVP